MPAGAVGVGAVVGPVEGPAVPPGPAAGEQAAEIARTSAVAAGSPRGRRGVPEAGRWSVMARQTIGSPDRFPGPIGRPIAVPSRTGAPVRDRRRVHAA
jgi:hypothetical protein